MVDTKWNSLGLCAGVGPPLPGKRHGDKISEPERVLETLAGSNQTTACMEQVIMADSQRNCRRRDSQGKFADASQGENESSAIRRFWARVQKSDESSCWIWNGSVGSRGYGSLYVTSNGRKRKELAHRFSFSLHFGHEGDVVMHKCDNPLCVNPSHLRSGTHQENQRDKVSKHRQASGESQGHAKLTVEQVVEIKRLLSLGRTLKQVALLFGVKSGCISGIKYGHSWKHVKGE